MKWIFLDEAGTSAREPCVTVGGLIVDADKQHRAIKEHLLEILEDVPAQLRADLIFHAKDIWHGNKQFERGKWASHGIDKEDRRDLLKRICKIPSAIGTPVVIGFVEKAHHWGDWKRMLGRKPVPSLNPNRANYALAFGMCAISAEAYLRERCPKNEVGQIVAEDTNEMREHAEWAYSLLENEQHTWSEQLLPYLPLDRLAEGPQFAAKRRSAILQVADAIAFVVNRHFRQNTPETDVSTCYEAFRAEITYSPYITM